MRFYPYWFWICSLVSDEWIVQGVQWFQAIPGKFARPKVMAKSLCNMWGYLVHFSFNFNRVFTTLYMETRGMFSISLILFERTVKIMREKNQLTAFPYFTYFLKYLVMRTSKKLNCIPFLYSKVRISCLSSITHNIAACWIWVKVFY